jgi:hypothetical protein
MVLTALIALIALHLSIPLSVTEDHDKLYPFDQHGLHPLLGCNQNPSCITIAFYWHYTHIRQAPRIALYHLLYSLHLPHFIALTFLLH